MHWLGTTYRAGAGHVDGPKGQHALPDCQLYKQTSNNMQGTMHKVQALQHSPLDAC